MNCDKISDSELMQFFELEKNNTGWGKFAPQRLKN